MRHPLKSAPFVKTLFPTNKWSKVLAHPVSLQDEDRFVQLTRLDYYDPLLPVFPNIFGKLSFILTRRHKPYAQRLMCFLIIWAA